MGSIRNEQLDRIVRLCADIEDAVAAADWERAGTLLSRRQELLGSVFAEPATSAAEVRELKLVARRVMAFDNDLMPRAETARAEAAEQLKLLRRGREATAAYKQHSG